MRNAPRIRLYDLTLMVENRIAKAAKMMRIKTHPDKLKKPEMSEEETSKIDLEAQQVGQAADVLMDAEQVSSNTCPI